MNLRNDEDDLMDLARAPLLIENQRLRKVNAKLLEALELVNSRWRFNNDQHHTHTWHDWADCQPAIKSAIALAKGEN